MGDPEGRGFSPAEKPRKRRALAPEAAPFDRRDLLMNSLVVPAVPRYIQNQRAHHNKMSLDSEFLSLLKKHNLLFNPKFALA